MDTNEYIIKLKESNPLRESTIHSAIKALNLSQGSHGLDVGCGIGAQAMLLAEAIGPAGHITGLDLMTEFLDYGREDVKVHGLSERITFKKGNMNSLPFDENVFDWAWSMDCVGYHPSNSEPAIKELIRVVKPGGTINLLAWSSESLLPGYPLLEAKLGATSVGLAPFSKGKNPKTHFLRMINQFQNLELEEINTHTFAGDTFAPLKEDIYNALAGLIEMRWPGVESELSKSDRKEYKRLCLPDSPDYILNLPDYYAFFTYTMFSGKVKK